MKSPAQELYDWFFDLSANQWQLTTYDHLPLENEPTPYPFVLIGSTVLASDATKTSLEGVFTQTVDIWGLGEQRLAVSDLANRFLRAVNRDIRTEHYRFAPGIWQSGVELTTDQSVPNQVFQHANLSLRTQLS